VLPAIDDHDRIGSGNIQILAVRAHNDVVDAATDPDRRDGSFCWLRLVRVAPRLSHVIPIITDAVQHLLTDLRFQRRGNG
jgi:hypothetical protein